MNAKFINLTELADIEGIVFCLQGQRNFLNGGAYFPLESPQAFEFAYACVQGFVKQYSPNIPVYIMQPDRNFSMLFDNDPLASARVLPIGNDLEVSLLNIQLSRVNYKGRPVNVVPDISGRWSGTIYWREFQTPDDKPYLFLGRYRVLVKPETALHSYLKKLADDNRFATIANTIHLLREDEAGHNPEALSAYV
ncbi:TPA: hypothetical protein O4I50_004714 [Vibrio parahaemolyticus]|nr:hypothetical protein [Vibrio parahaemolyticus]